MIISQKTLPPKVILGKSYKGKIEISSPIFLYLKAGEDMGLVYINPINGDQDVRIHQARDRVDQNLLLKNSNAVKNRYKNIEKRYIGMLRKNIAASNDMSFKDLLKIEEEFKVLTGGNIYEEIQAAYVEQYNRAAAQINTQEILDLTTTMYNSRKGEKEEFLKYLNRLIEIIDGNSKGIAAWTKVAKNKNKVQFLSENNITFNENIEFGEDYEFNIDYIKSVEQAELINEPLYNYYISSNSLTTKYRENEFQIRKHNIDKNKELYRHKNYDLEWISHLYLEMFIQSSISLFNNKSASKNTIISKIKEYSETIYNDIKANYQNFFRKEEIFVGKMIYRKKYHVIYRYIKLRILIKKIIYKLRRKKNRQED